MLPPDAELICAIKAGSWNEAQQQRYGFMGRGHYKTLEEKLDSEDPQAIPPNRLFSTLKINAIVILLTKNPRENAS